MVYVKKYTAQYITASPAVASNLVAKHGVPETQIESIYEFINRSENGCALPDKQQRRRELGLPSDKVLVFGCGTAYWRKGPDIFVDVAANLLSRGIRNFHFYWIGEDMEDVGKDVQRRELASHVTFLGSKDTPREWFPAGDMFLLPSREDPFPLVCLEAAEAGLPVICFEDAGGMPDFVRDDAGYTVPYGDAQAMADKVAALIENEANCRQRGDCARNRLLTQHTSEQAMPEILRCIRSTASIQPKVSVVVPCYNHAPFVRQRLDSIFQQTFQDFEVIILDDGSSDGTRDIIEGYRSHANVRILLNEQNSGSTFAQWIRGIDRANADLIWIAEDDDLCERTLLERLVPCFHDPDVRLAYCQSVAVDQHDRHLFNYTIHTDQFSTTRWRSDYVADIAEELNAGLAVRNTIPNASAVVFQKFDLLNLRNSLPGYRLTGDWVFYLHAINGGKVAFCADSLNYHRRHPSTCIARYQHDPLRMYETEDVHRLAASMAPLTDKTVDAMEQHLEELRCDCRRRAA
jgi:hypothetical protein